MKKITDYAELVKAKHALNKTIAPVEDGASMTGSYTSGQQFIRDGVLYTALTSIAASTAFSSLTLDTDYEVADDITSQLSSVNSALSNTNTALGNEVATRTKLGGHNLLPNEATTQTINGVTFTVNNDGSITANGTCNGEGTAFTIKVKPKLEDDVQYILTGCPKNSGAILFYSSNVDVVYNDYGDGVQFTKLNYTTYPSASVGIYVPNGTTLNDAIFKPMIRLASDTDDTFQPYSMTNQEITPYVQAISNPNLLDNPWFTVNQRGANSYTGSNKYSFDRWLLSPQTSGYDCSISKSNDVLTVTAHTEKHGSILQYLEEDLSARLLGKTITISIILSDGTIETATATISSSVSAWTIVASIGKADWGLALEYTNTSKFQFFVRAYANKSVSFKAVKLELGSVSTLAMDTAPNYATELLKCQRYFCRLGESSSGYPICVGRAHNATQGRYLIKLPVEMRTNAVVTISDLTKVRELCNHMQNSPTAFSAGGMDKGGYLQLYTTTSGLVTDELVGLMLNTAYIDVSAEL